MSYLWKVLAHRRYAVDVGSLLKPPSSEKFITFSGVKGRLFGVFRVSSFQGSTSARDGEGQ